jgi:hypothetical protein
VEEGLGGGADVVAALRVPLDAEDEVMGVWGLAAFYGFDDSVLRAAGGDAEAVAENADGLMVAGVDGQSKEPILLWGFGGFFESFLGGDDGSKEGVGGDGSGMRDGYTTAGGVVDGKDVEVLYQGSSAPDVEGLEAEADREDGLVEVVGVLNEEFVYIFPRWVGWRALGNRVLAIFVRVDVCRAAGKEDCLTGINKIRGLRGGRVEGDLDGLAAAVGDGCGVHGPGALVVVEVSAGGDGDGYAGLHAENMILLCRQSEKR